MKRFLIAGLGNPGKSYERTRHNVGFEVVQLLARKHHLEFQKKLKFKGAVAEGTIGSSSVLLMMPLTFMNLSGAAVALVMRYLQVELSHLLVVVDDVAIPMGELRLRTDSSSGGHNGLKSIEEHLQSCHYARLRVGVGASPTGDLTSHVLGRFSEEEKKSLPEILERAARAVEVWLEQGISHAMHIINAPNPSNGGKNNG